MTDETTQTTDTKETTPTPAAKPAPTLAEPTFTQADIDRIVGERAKRAKETGIADLLKELGFEKPEDLKAIVANAKKAEDEKKSDIQKLQDEIEKSKQRFEAERQRADSAEAARIADKVNSRIEAFAVKAKAQYPEDVVKFLRENHAEEVKALVGEDGSINDKATEKLLETVKKARPTWFGVTGPGSPSNRDGKPPTPDVSKQLGDKPLFRM